MAVRLKVSIVLICSVLIIIGWLAFCSDAQAQEALETLQTQMNTATLTVVQLQAQRAMLDAQTTVIMGYITDTRRNIDDQINELNLQRQAIDKKMKVMMKAMIPAPESAD